MSYILTIPSPTTILTRRTTIDELAHPDKKDDTLIIEIDDVDLNGLVHKRSALVDKVTLSFVRDADPQNTIKVSFAHPEIPERVYNRGDQVTVHYLTFEHLE